MSHSCVRRDGGMLPVSALAYDTRAGGELSVSTLAYDTRAGGALSVTTLNKIVISCSLVSVFLPDVQCDDLGELK